ncbi:MAG TPA: molybdenum cofactor guanylyltransferase [Chthoniobacterales bacterium]|nr:molybdenum cofactor guanylyltransferase [Chthoniobacterales bacterium]
MKLSAALLAGGESRRMGQDKATVLFRGKPLWQTQLNLLRELTPAEIFISARTDRRWRPPDVQFIRDEPPSRGPLSGIAATLGQITTSHLLALAIDMPFMTAPYLRLLCGRAQPGRGVVPIIRERAEPLAAIYSRAAHADLIAAFAGTDFSLQSVVRKLIASGKLMALNVTHEQEPLFRNLNEPRDLQ